MTNRLQHATSPYLLQHADNPVHWWEWSDEAFDEARRRDVPVLLSVGYAACHWCHVMAHESFEDEATARLMNEHFVNIKVDREERPDVDALYMQATTAMTGQGGWPMTVVMTPDGEPFFCGTYFPDQPRHGQPAFIQLLQALSEAWRDRRADVAEVAANVRGHLQAQGRLGAAPVDAEVLDAAVQTLAGEFDQQEGGFGRAPKFPPSMVLEFLLRHAARTGSSTSLSMVDRTCEAMARGGMYDQLGGGFARYSVDREWVVPHFEKMLYDNAQLVGLYARWWRQTGNPVGARVARESANFLLEELRTAQGGFASSLDADTDGVEGKFYVWSQADLAAVLGDEDGPWAARLLEVTPHGTFEHGASTLQRREDPDDEQRWDRVRRALLAERATRTRPARDDKVVAAWNGLAIGSLAEAGALLEEPAFLDAAEQAAELVWRVHWDGQRLRRVSRDGVVGRPGGVLEDYACLAQGLLQLFSVTATRSWLDRAGVLLETALDLFTADDGGFFDTPRDGEQLLARPRDPSDNASPSGHAALTHALLTWAALHGSGRHRDRAEGALGQVHPLAVRAPRFAGWSLAAAEAAVAGPVEIAVVGRDDDPLRAELLAVARRATSPGAVVVAGAPQGEAAGADAGQAAGEGAGEAAGAAVPLLAGRGLVEGRAAAYVCRQLVCRRPVTSVDDLAAELDQLDLT